MCLWLCESICFIVFVAYVHTCVCCVHVYLCTFLHGLLFVCGFIHLSAYVYFGAMILMCTWA